MHWLTLRQPTTIQAALSQGDLLLPVEPKNLVYKQPE